jgi:hypothetical protein
MNSAVVFGSHSGRATPSRRATPKTAAHDPNRQRFHLSTAETCPDKAGHLYKADRRNAMHLRERDDISRRLAEILAGREQISTKATERAIERTAITKQRVAEELAKIGLAKTGLGGDDEFLDLSELTREQAAMLQVKRGALMDIAKLFGYVTDKSEVKHIDEFERMDADELRAHIAKMGPELGIPVKPLTTETSARLRGCNGSPGR